VQGTIDKMTILMGSSSYKVVSPCSPSGRSIKMHLDFLGLATDILLFCKLSLTVIYMICVSWRTGLGVRRVVTHSDVS
jgi:hypothetical protein